MSKPKPKAQYIGLVDDDDLSEDSDGQTQAPTNTPKDGSTDLTEATENSDNSFEELNKKAQALTIEPNDESSVNPFTTRDDQEQSPTDETRYPLVDNPFLIDDNIQNVTSNEHEDQATVNPFTRHNSHESRDEITVSTEATLQMSFLPSAQKNPSKNERILWGETPPRWWYRAWSRDSQGKLDSKGNMVAAVSNHVFWSLDELALHFAEYHSDKENKEPTALVSVTNDPIKAIKDAYWRYHFSDYRLELFISAIYSAKPLISTELATQVMHEPLWSKISKATQDRLTNPNFMNFFETEAVFRGAVEHSEVCITLPLSTLIERGLLTTVLPEMLVQTDFRNSPSPKKIREAVRAQCKQDNVEIANRYRQLYHILVHEEDRHTSNGLMAAQSMMDDDLSLSYAVRAEGLRMYGAELLSWYNPTAGSGDSDEDVA